MHFRSKLLLLTCVVLLSAFIFSEELIFDGDLNFQPEEHLEELDQKSGRETPIDYKPPRVGVFIGSFQMSQRAGRARAVVTSHPTAAASRVYSLSVTLLGARGRRPWNKRQDDQELVLRGMDLLGNGSVMALGQVRKEQEWLSTRSITDSEGEKYCRLEALLHQSEDPSSEAVRFSHENRSHIAAEVISPDCSFSLQLELQKVDLELLSRKVLNYGVLMNTLTLLQLRSFLSQMRYHEEEHATVTKLSALGIAMQALMDAYDSFLHLSVAAPVQVLNTYSFAVVSMLKFSLFALVEIRYLLLIWRHQNQHMFAEGWEAVRQELSRVYAQFYGALVSGLVLIFIASDYLDFVALLMQAYWLPQIVYDVRHGSKNSFTHFFVFSIAATRSLQFLYLFGCPAGIFDGEIYPHLPGAPSLELCLAAVVIQVAQVSVMISQRHLGPRWFVPWLCLPHVYNYRRHSQGSLQSECVICMLEIGPEDGVIATTPCEHRFHEACLERWMDVKMECPTCRRALPPM